MEEGPGARPPNLKSFDVGFVVDVTGSMDPCWRGFIVM